MSYSQANRQIAIETPLGTDRLLLAALRGEEHVSQVFRFEADLLSEDSAIAPADIIGKAVAVRLRCANGEDRWINGCVSEFRAGWTTLGGLRQYQAEIVPWFWFLTNHVDCRIFQDLTVVEIAETLFGEFGFADYDLSYLTASHPRWDYCTQYQESAYDFLCRLFEHEGIFWYFRHSKDKHTLVLADVNQAFLPGLEPEVDVQPGGSGLGVITDWQHRYRFHAGRFSTSDYNFVDPDMPLRSDRRLLQPVATMDRYERYEWPGDYYTAADGDALVRHRLEEAECSYHRVDGTSTCPSFTPGQRIKVIGHPNPAEDGKAYALLSIHHEAEEPTYLSRDAQPVASYRNRFSAFPMISTVTGAPLSYRPPRRTPTPTIDAIQTAMVVGPAGETIHTDKYARVKVHFHWDRHDGKDEHSSCWVRVSQAWAGKDYGQLQIPHVGQEVIVSFLEGDPDRPLIVGRVFNGLQANPLVAEALTQKTQQINRDQGGNQIMTEGADGKQVVRMYSPQSETHMSLGTMPKDMPTPSLPDGIPHPPGGFPSGGGGSGTQAQASQPAPARRRLSEVLSGYASEQAGADRGSGSSQQQMSSTATPVTPSGYVSLDSTKNDAEAVEDEIESVPGISTWTSGPSIDSSSYKLVYVKGDTVTVTEGDKYAYTIGNSVSHTRGGSVTETLGGTFTTFLGARASNSLTVDVTLILGLRIQTNALVQLNSDIGYKLTSVVGIDQKMIGSWASTLAVVGATMASLTTAYAAANRGAYGAVPITVGLSGVLAAAGAALAAKFLPSTEIKMYPTASVVEIGLNKYVAIGTEKKVTLEQLKGNLSKKQINAVFDELNGAKKKADATSSQIAADEKIAMGMQLESIISAIEANTAKLENVGVKSTQ